MAHKKNHFLQTVACCCNFWNCLCCLCALGVPSEVAIILLLIVNPGNVIPSDKISNTVRIEIGIPSATALPIFLCLLFCCCNTEFFCAIGSMLSCINQCFGHRSHRRKKGYTQLFDIEDQKSNTPPPKYFSDLYDISPPGYDSGYQGSEHYKAIKEQLGIITEELKGAIMDSAISSENQIIHTNITLTPNIRADIATLRSKTPWQQINCNLEKMNILAIPEILENHLFCQKKEEMIAKIQTTIENVLMLVRIGEKITNQEFYNADVLKWLETNIVDCQLATILHVRDVDEKKIIDYQINWNKKTLEKLCKTLLTDPIKQIFTSIQNNWSEPPSTQPNETQDESTKLVEPQKSFRRYAALG